MSKKTQESKAAELKAWKRTLYYRRWVLSGYLLLAVLCTVGSQGPWYQTFARGKAFGEAKWGGDFAWQASTGELDEALAKLEGREDGVAPVGSALPEEIPELDLDEEPEPRKPSFSERPGFQAQLVLWCGLAALFFAGFNLASNATLDWPVLIVSVLTAAAVGSVFHALSVAPSTLRRVVEDVTAAGGTGAGSGGVAAVDSSTLPGLLNTISIRFSWGVALMGASAPLLVLKSFLLTFFLKRKP